MFNDEPILLGQEWHFPNGKILPLVSGGSDIPPTGDPAPVGDSGQPVVEEQDPSPDSLVDGFLKDVADEHKEIVRQYVKPWDAGVTKRFQSIHDSYKPYKELEEQLGGPDGLQEAARMYNILNEQPEVLYQVLGNILEQEGILKNNKPPVGGSVSNIEENEPDPYEERFGKLEGMLENLARNFMETQNSLKSREEDERLETNLSAAKQKLGDVFNEPMYLGFLNAGMEPDQAIVAYETFVDELKQQLAPKKATPPPSLTGGEVVPLGDKNVAEMDSKEVNSLVAQILSNRT